MKFSRHNGMTPEHPRPVNKLAALHVAGGDRLGREELLWEQREVFERVVTAARLQNMEEQQKHRRDLSRVAHKLAQDTERLDTLPPQSFYTKDFKRHIDKIRKRVGRAERPVLYALRFEEQMRLATLDRIAQATGATK